MEHDACPEGHDSIIYSAIVQGVGRGHRTKRIQRGDRTHVCHWTHTSGECRAGEIGLTCIMKHTPAGGCLIDGGDGYGIHRGDRTLFDHITPPVGLYI